MGCNILSGNSNVTAMQMVKLTLNLSSSVFDKNMGNVQQQTSVQAHYTSDKINLAAAKGD